MSTGISSVLTHMYLRYLYYVLWVAPVPVYVCLAAVMMRRKVHTAMPLFFAYTLFQIFNFGILFYSYQRYPQHYFVAYWTVVAIEVGIGFGIIYEIFKCVFHPFVALRDLGAVLFRWAALVLVMFAVLMASNGTTVLGQRITSSLVNLDRSIQVMQCGLVLLMILCSSYLGLTLKHRVFGIAVGLGMNAAVELIAVTILVTLGQGAANTVRLTKMVTYNLSAWVWLVYIWRGAVEVQPAKRLTYAERWDYALASATNPGAESPALPLIEDVVERVWNETNGKGNGNGGSAPRHADQ